MMEGLKDYDEYQAQNLDAQFGDFYAVTERDVSEFRTDAMKSLSKVIVKMVDIYGYESGDSKPKWIEKVPDLSMPTSDPLDTRGTLAGKINAKLTATKAQYNHYLYDFAKTVLEDFHAEVMQRMELQESITKILDNLQERTSK